MKPARFPVFFLRQGPHGPTLSLVWVVPLATACLLAGGPVTMGWQAGSGAPPRDVARAEASSPLDRARRGGLDVAARPMPQDPPCSIETLATGAAADADEGAGEATFSVPRAVLARLTGGMMTPLAGPGSGLRAGRAPPHMGDMG